MWLALLFVFIGLARSGWIEYRKVEAYRAWAASFDRAKYDIYAVLGQKEQSLTWGQPTPKGPINLKHCSIDTVADVLVQVDGRLIDLNHPPDKGKSVELVLQNHGNENLILIPFTDMTMAVEWAQYLITVI